MKNTYALTTLTLVNLGMMILVLFHHSTPVEASGPLPVVRSRAFEIIDAKGDYEHPSQLSPQVRRAERMARRWNGNVYPEAVVFRLIRPDGRPSVKIATTEQGSGIDLSGGIDPTNTVLSSEGGETSLTLTNQDGHRQIIKP